MRPIFQQNLSHPYNQEFSLIPPQFERLYFPFEQISNIPHSSFYMPKPIFSQEPTQIDSIRKQSKNFEVYKYTNDNTELNISKSLEILNSKCFPTKVQYMPGSLVYLLKSKFEEKVIAVAAFQNEKYSEIPDIMWKRGSYYLYNVCTDPEYRGMHLQEELLKIAFNDIRAQGARNLQIYLMVHTDNTSAIRLYERLGFQTLAILPKLHEHDKQKYLMYV